MPFPTSLAFGGLTPSLPFALCKHSVFMQKCPVMSLCHSPCCFPSLPLQCFSQPLLNLTRAALEKIEAKDLQTVDWALKTTGMPTQSLLALRWRMALPPSLPSWACSLRNTC